MESKFEKPLRIKRRGLGLAAGPRAKCTWRMGRPGRRGFGCSGREAFERGGGRGADSREALGCGDRPRRLPVKEIGLPAGDAHEAWQMLAYELPALVPLSPDAVCHGMWRIGSGQEEMVRYAVFVSPQERVERAVEPLTKAGLVPGRVLPDSIAAWRCCAGDPARKGRGCWSRWTARRAWQSGWRGRWRAARGWARGPDGEPDAGAASREIRQFSQALPEPGRARGHASHMCRGCPDVARQAAAEMSEEPDVALQVDAEPPDILIDPDSPHEISHVSAICALGCAMGGPLGVEHT